MSAKEGFLHDYLAASFIGLALGLYVSVTGAALAGNWGPFIASVIISGIFLSIPAGFVSSYVNFRSHRMSDDKKMGGLNAGFFTAVVYTTITLISAIVSSIAFTAGAADFFIAWILGAVFAFIFMMLGGYIEGTFEDRPFAMPSIFNMEKVQRLPPPPPATNVPTCPICGRPMRFIEQYNRWYCDYDKKYA